jgi:hypothetical protein
MEHTCTINSLNRIVVVTVYHRRLERQLCRATPELLALDAEADLKIAVREDLLRALLHNKPAGFVVSRPPLPSLRLLAARCHFFFPRSSSGPVFFHEGEAALGLAHLLFCFVFYLVELIRAYFFEREYCPFLILRTCFVLQEVLQALESAFEDK